MICKVLSMQVMANGILYIEMNTRDTITGLEQVA